jgi:hypothetical protein
MIEALAQIDPTRDLDQVSLGTRNDVSLLRGSWRLIPQHAVPASVVNAQQAEDSGSGFPQSLCCVLARRGRDTRRPMRRKSIRNDPGRSPKSADRSNRDKASASSSRPPAAPVCVEGHRRMSSERSFGRSPLLAVEVPLARTRRAPRIRIPPRRARLLTTAIPTSPRHEATLRRIPLRTARTAEHQRVSEPKRQICARWKPSSRRWDQSPQPRPTTTK